MPGPAARAALLLVTISAAVAIEAQAPGPITSNPLPEPVAKKGIAVQIRMSSGCPTAAACARPIRT